MGWAKQAVEWGFIDASIEGDGALGKGLRWEIGEVLDKDSEDYERAKKAWKKLCEERYENEKEDPPADQPVDDIVDTQDTELDSLLFATSSDAPPKDSLLLNEDGQISYSLFWAAVCELQPALKDPHAAARRVDVLAGQAQQAADGTTGMKSKESDSRTVDPDIGRLARHLVTLFERRIARTSHPTQTAAELCDMVDKVSFSQLFFFCLAYPDLGMSAV